MEIRPDEELIPPGSALLSGSQTERRGSRIGDQRLRRGVNRHRLRGGNEGCHLSFIPAIPRDPSAPEGAPYFH